MEENEKQKNYKSCRDHLLMHNPYVGVVMYEIDFMFQIDRREAKKKRKYVSIKHSFGYHIVRMQIT